MTHLALSHAASVPNVPTPMGGMSHDKMLEFVHKVAEKGIKNFDQGGVAAGGIGGAIGNVLGTNNQYQAGAAPITAGTSVGQLQQGYNQAQGALGTQGQVSNALNQGLYQGANQQQALGQQLTLESQGVGPNPAQAQFNQNTGTNIAQQAALAAGQRGAGANAGLIAAQNAQQGAATQQNAVGQEATLSAQQQLAAQQNLQNLSANQISQGQGALQGLNNAAQNEQSILQGANTSFNNANVSQQSNINSVNAGVSEGNQTSAGNVIGSLANGVSGAASFIGSLFADGGMVKMDKGGNVLDANARKHIAPHNFALPGGRYPIHDINHARNALARVSQNGTPEEKAKVKAAVHKKYPSLAGDKKMACGGMAMADGGEVKKERQQVERAPMVRAPQMMAMGGLSVQPTSAPQSFVGNWLNSGASSSPSPSIISTPVSGTPQGANPFGNLRASAVSSAPIAEAPLPGSRSSDYTSLMDAGNGTGSTAGDYMNLPDNPAPEEGTFVGNDNFQNSTMAASGGLMKKGGKVKARNKDEEPEKKDDSLENDKVPAMLSAGEIVLPRHITMHPNAPAMAAQFVAKELAKRSAK